MLFIDSTSAGISCYCRLEEICFRRKDGFVKILGTIICVSGAVIMSAYKGMVVYQHGGEATPPPGLQGYTQPFKHLAGYGLHSSILQFEIGNYQLGGLCLVFNCTSWAVYLILQVCHLNPIFSTFCKSPNYQACHYDRITVFVNLGLYWHFETITNIRT